MRSGTRIDKRKDGTWDLIYFGNFSQCIESQTLHIRSLDDLADIIDKLQDLYSEYPD